MPKFDKDYISLNSDKSIQLKLHGMLRADQFVCVIYENINDIWKVLKNMTIFESSEQSEECCMDGIPIANTKMETIEGYCGRDPNPKKVSVSRKCIGMTVDGLFVEYRSNQEFKDFAFRPFYQVNENESVLVHCGGSHYRNQSYLKIGNNSADINRFNDGSVLFLKSSKNHGGVYECIFISPNQKEYTLRAQLNVKGVRSSQPLTVKSDKKLLKEEELELDEIYYTLYEDYRPGRCPKWIKAENSTTSKYLHLCCKLDDKRRICTTIFVVPSIHVIKTITSSTSCEFKYYLNNSMNNRIHHFSLWLRQFGKVDWNQYIVDRESKRFNLSNLTPGTIYEYAFSADSTEWPIITNDIRNFTTSSKETKSDFNDDQSVFPVQLEKKGGMFCLATASTLPLDVRYITLQSRRINRQWSQSPVAIPASKENKCVKNTHIEGLVELKISYFAIDRNLETTFVYIEAGRKRSEDTKFIVTALSFCVGFLSVVAATSFFQLYMVIKNLRRVEEALYSRVNVIYC
ncbi:hypothetical protein ACOME3_007824 [Neoechinorhynchus agilis]